MYRISSVIGIALCLTLAASNASADHHVAGEIEVRTRQMFQALRRGEFKELFANFATGHSVYLNYGLLKELPNEQVKSMIVKLYEDRYEEGLRIDLTPRYVQVVVRGDTAIATYLSEGTITTPENDEPIPQLIRHSTVWQKLDDQWQAVHSHWSNLEKEPAEDD